MTRISSAGDLDGLDFAKGGGVVTVVTQDASNGNVLMVAHADREALQQTLATGEMHYRSRTRGLWHKGATSGNVQRVVALDHDCDADAVLALVAPSGPTCHMGTTSCFSAAFEADALSRLDRVIDERARVASPGSYTNRLLGDRNLRLKKLGEECAELVTALADGDTQRATEEGADLIYHALAALRAAGIRLADLQAELDKRHHRAR